MAIAVRSAQGSNNAGGGTTLTMAVPAGVVDGDILVMSVDVRGGTGTTITLPSAWTARTNPFASTDRVKAVAFGAGLFVAGGGDQGFTGPAVFATSPDGTTWTSRSEPWSGTVQIVQGIAYDGSVLVAVSDQSKVATSPDGITWTSQTIANVTNLWCVGWGNGLFVAGGAVTATKGRITTSPDGVTWTERTGALAADVYGIAYGAGLFVAVGDDAALVATSPDGITWTTRTANNAGAQLYDVAWNGSLFVAGGFCIVTSPDGITWTKRTSSFVDGTDQIRGVEYANGLWTATSSNGKIATSPDGINWTQQTNSFAGTDTIFGVAYGAGAWVAVGSNGKIASNGGQWTQLTSTDSTTNLRSRLYWKVAASEPASYVLTITSNKASGEMIALSGADATLPGAAQYGAQANASSATVAAPALGSWTSANGIDLFFGGSAIGTTVTTPPTSYTKPTNGESASTGGSASTRTTSGVAFRALSGVTTVGALSATYAAAAVNVGGHVFIKEVPPAPPPFIPHTSPYVQLLAQ